MSSVQPRNLLDIDFLVKNFIDKYNQGINTMHRLYFHNDDQLSLRALIAGLTDELRTGCTTFFNKGLSAEELDPYLFYIANAYCKKISVPLVNKKSEYICPGCFFLGKDSPVVGLNKILKCDTCKEELKSVTDPKQIIFFKTFVKHNKNGYRCNDCKRFIPHPLDESLIISCPYLDCCFVGSYATLKKMHHPVIKSNVEITNLDANIISGTSSKDNIPSNDMDARSALEAHEDLQNKIKVIKDVIEYQSNNVSYNSSDFTTKHKYLVYQSFVNILEKEPEEMINYLLNVSRSGGFQHKIFQEYINLLEEAIPFHFRKNNKLYKINSLLDNNLKLFDGISVFEGMISEKLDIKNNTKEFYIGGRKASYTKPYYIGKLLSIVTKENKIPITNLVVEYSFSKIKMKGVAPGTKVIVTHLRVPPHYQMGGMVYVNRVRKKIVDRAKFILNKGDVDII